MTSSPENPPAHESPPAAPRWRTLSMLLLVLAACLPAMLIELDVRDSTHSMENIALAVSQETWLRHHAGEADAWLVTRNDDQPRLEKPPLLTWLNFAAWSNLDPDTARPAELIPSARLIAVAMALVLVTAIFWLGCTLGDLKMAAIAALVAGSMFFLQRQARVASYDIHFTAWATLAVAAALWAMNPRGEAPGRPRQIVGWLLSGLAMGASVLAKNPLPLVLVTLPVAVVIALMPGRRMAATIGLLGALALAAIIFAPWYIYVAVVYDNAVGALGKEFSQPRGDDVQPLYYYASIVVLVAPWSLWLISGLVHPFMPAAAGRRRLLLISLLWFALVLVFFTIPDAKQQRYILPIAPAAALLIARVWRDHAALAERGERDHSAHLLIRAHWIILLLIGLSLGPFLAMQDSIFTSLEAWREQLAASAAAGDHDPGFPASFILGDDWPEKPAIGSVSAPSAFLLGVLLTLLAAWGWLTHRQWRPLRALLISAAWAQLFLGVCWYCYAHAPSGVNPVRAEAEAFAARAGDAPVLSLRITDHDRIKYLLDEEFRFYYGRTVDRVAPAEMAERLAAIDGAVYVLAADRADHQQVMAAAGLIDEGLIEEDKGELLRVWSRPG